MSHPLALSIFEGMIDSAFQVRLENESVELTLAEIVKMERAPKNYECFTLLFKGPVNPMLEQRIYRFEHGESQTWDLFVVPVAGDDTGYDYEVIINRQT